MERILVGIDARTPFWEALDRALCLGARIRARVDVLTVFSREGEATSGAGLETLKRVEAQVAAAAQAGASACGHSSPSRVPAAGGFIPVSWSASGFRVPTRCRRRMARVAAT